MKKVFLSKKVILGTCGMFWVLASQGADMSMVLWDAEKNIVAVCDNVKPYVSNRPLPSDRLFH